MVLKVCLWCVHINLGRDDFFFFFFFFYKKWENDVHFSYHRSNINGPGTPRPLNRPKIPLSVPMTTNGLPESTDSKESKQNEDKNHRFVCDLFLKTCFPEKVTFMDDFSALLIYYLLLFWEGENILMHLKRALAYADDGQRKDLIACLGRFYL